MHRTVMSVLAASAVVLVTACGGNDSASGSLDGDTREKLIDAMVSEGGTRENAECLVDALGSDAEKLWSMDEANMTEEQQETFFGAAEKCL